MNYPLNPQKQPTEFELGVLTLNEMKEYVCLMTHVALDFTELQEQVFYRVEKSHTQKNPQVCFL